MIKMMTNTAVPNKPVTALKGISESVNDLDKMSVRITKDPPKVMQRGMVLFVLCPTIRRTICGMTKPIQEIVPQKQTEMAVSKVAIPMMR